LKISVAPIMAAMASIDARSSSKSAPLVSLRSKCKESR
jgi:hypothetical protein